jgi:hypothetical protein
MTKSMFSWRADGTEARRSSHKRVALVSGPPGHRRRLLRRLSGCVAFLSVGLLAACGGGGADGTSGDPSSASSTVGGTVTGLAGTGLVLQNSGGDSTAVSVDGSFTFPGALVNGTAYDVTVSAQPSSPSQTCTVSNGSGSVGTSDVSNVVVSCTTDAHPIGGTISGLLGSGLVLQDNGGDNLSVTTNAAGFTFATGLASGASYNVTVLKQPDIPAQSCTVANGSGVVGSADVTGIALTCVAEGSGTDGMPSRIAIDKSSVFLPGVGKTVQLHAQVLDANGHVLAGAPVMWTSSAPDRVVVDPSGAVSGVAIGSALIFGKAGSLQSLPVIAIVAQPATGALLLTDAQIVSVGMALNLDVDGVPGVGTQYEVTLQNAAAPAPGTVVIATEKQPVTGAVVATRQDATGLVVTLALVPASQLFSAYDIDLTIDLSTFPMQAAPSEAVQSIGAPRRTAVQKARPQGTSPLAPFQALDCDASVKAQLLGDPPFLLTVTNQLTLKIQDRPGFTLRALQGTFTLDPSVTLNLQAGFKATGSCEAAAQIPIAVDGPLGIFVAPAIRLGFGVGLSGTVIVVQGNVGVSGRLGITDVSIGYECSEVSGSSTCDTLNGSTVVNELTPHGQFPDTNGMQAVLSGQFYFLAGFDATFLLGTVTADLLRAKIGPQQSFDLAFEDDQAARTDYASHYDLKLIGTIEPGNSLKKVIGEVLGGSVDVSVKPQFSADISQSPKGTLTVSSTRSAIGNPVDFTVNFDPNTVDYFLLGNNVTGVQLYRKAANEDKFTFWRYMDVIASNSPTYSYRWMPSSTDDLGKADYAAFVDTSLLPQGLGPVLEIAPNSIQTVEIGCFSSGSAPSTQSLRGAKIQATSQDAGGTCADQWSGTVHFDDGAEYGDVNITFSRDPNYNDGTPSDESYIGQGHGTFHSHLYDNLGCTIDPTTFDFDASSTAISSNLWVAYGLTPAPFSLTGKAQVQITVTCPGPSGGGPIVSHVTVFPNFLPGLGGNVSPDGTTIQGSSPPGGPGQWSFQFTRQ